MKLLCVGDIHTKTWIIDEIEKLVVNYDAIVFVGDYADDWTAGPTQSIATWYALKAFMDNHKNVHAVIGNHDYSYIHAEIAGRSSGWNQVTFTLLNAPENKELKNWLLSLPVVFQLDGITFSHAGITAQWDGDESVYGLWNDTSPIWARPQEFGGYQTSYKDIPQVFGHNPSKEIWQPAPNAWCIDVFSETQNNVPIGDQTVLEIIGGKFNIKRLLNENNSSITRVENDLS